jgi:2-polyprenyl-6-methoxyphenol hydroxylase-like FAD-dependent oxidoreductase
VSAGSALIHARYVVGSDGGHSTIRRLSPRDAVERLQSGSYARFGRSQRSTSSTDRPRRTA